MGGEATGTCPTGPQHQMPGLGKGVRRGGRVVWFEQGATHPNPGPLLFVCSAEPEREQCFCGFSMPLDTATLTPTWSGAIILSGSVAAA